MITGESNENLDIVLAKIAQIVNDQKIAIKLHLKNEKDIPSAQKIANDLAQQLENRVNCRSALRILYKTKNFAVFINGRIDGAEMAQPKKVSQGKMPSGTFDSLIEPG